MVHCNTVPRAHPCWTYGPGRNQDKTCVTQLLSTGHREIDLSALLTVKFHQPSHEFTFGVDMSFILYPLVLTPLV
jgi:hypothetical protein